MLAWHEAEPGHELARVFEPRDITDLCHNRRGNCRVHAAQGAEGINYRRKMPIRDSSFDCLIQRSNPFLGLVHRAFEFLKDELLMRETEPAQLGEPSAVPLRPVATRLIRESMSQQEAE